MGTRESEVMWFALGLGKQVGALRLLTSNWQQYSAGPVGFPDLMAAPSLDKIPFRIAPDGEMKAVGASRW